MSLHLMFFFTITELFIIYLVSKINYITTLNFWVEFLKLRHFVWWIYEKTLPFPIKSLRTVNTVILRWILKGVIFITKTPYLCHCHFQKPSHNKRQGGQWLLYQLLPLHSQQSHWYPHPRPPRIQVQLPRHCLSEASAASRLASGSDLTVEVFFSFFPGFFFNQLSTEDLTTSLHWALSGALMATCINEFNISLLRRLRNCLCNVYNTPSSLWPSVAAR